MSVAESVWSLSKKKWKDVTAGHESIGPNLILLETEVKNYVATSGARSSPSGCTPGKPLAKLKKIARVSPEKLSF
jgi:hypothetical protein